MLGLFLLGIAGRARGGAALIAVFVGVLVIGWMTFSPELERFPTMIKNPLHTNMTIVVGTLTIFLVGVCVSRCLPASEASSMEQVS
jgi:SSS family solute:Na+ symporter